MCEVWFNQPVQEYSCFGQFSSKCYLRADEVPAIMRLFVNLQALATLLLQTIGSKRVANAQTMKNNGSKVASAFLFNI